MDISRGLTEKEAEAQRQKFGRNVLSKEERSPAISAFLSQLKNYMVYVLLAAAILSVIVGETLNAQVIGIILALIISLGFIQEYKATKAMESLKAMLSLFSAVVRDGKDTRVPSSEIVPEDILILKAGDRVPADAVAVDSKNLCVDESTLTGESVPCDKKAVRSPAMIHSAGDSSRLFAGTYVLSGKARAVVTHTGMNTRFGKIAKLMETESEEMPLEKDIRRLSRALAAGVLALSIIVFFVLWQRQDFAFGAAAIDAAIIVIALAVAGTPEGMPVVVTIMLALGMKNMASKNAIVRKMAAVESLGTVSVICADKTGTLTKNEMEVKKLFFGGRMIDLSRHTGGRGAEPMKPLLAAMVLCNDADINGGNSMEPKASGMPTEAAMLEAAARLGMEEDKTEAEFPRINEVPFNSERKIMSTLHSSKGGVLLVSKGSFEAILKRCSKMVGRNSKSMPLLEKDARQLERAHKDMCKDAMRVIAFASRSLRPKKLPKGISSLEENMTFLGMAGIADPLRPEARAAVQKCMDAGIKIVMITGDHPDTAAAVGKQLGISSGKSGIISGSDIDDMTDEELKERINDIRICARARPEHKLRMIRAFEAAGEIVAMTGDGVNDAPALKKADVGVAMASGTDVSRQSADIILKDNNFATIVSAVEEGRHIFDNIRKFVTYQLSCNFAQAAVIAAAIMLGTPLPLLALQILFVNLVTDDLPSIALSQNPKNPLLMKSSPRKPNEGMINRKMLAMMAAIGIALTAATLAAFHLNLWKGVALARTVALLSIILAELAIIFSFISLKTPLTKINIFANKWLVFAVVVSFVATLSVIYLPQLSAIFGTYPLGLPEWLAGASAALFMLLTVEAYKKYVFRK